MNDRVKTLEAAIKHLDTLYEVGDDCVLPDDLGKKLGFQPGEEVPDLTYDGFRRELNSLHPKSRIFKTATASNNKSKGIQKVKHDPPLTSIEKAGHEDRAVQEEMLFKWLLDCLAEAPAAIKNEPVFDLAAKDIDGKSHPERQYKGTTVTYPRKYFVQAYKLDGVALALYYEQGVLVKAGLRPRDGINGEDVTEQVKYVKGIPEKLNLPVTCSIRGEIICKLSDFEKVQKALADAGEDLRANPRNHAAGGIRQFKDPTKVKAQRLSFMGYGIEGLDNPPYKTEIERAKWCNKELGVPFVRVQHFNFYQLQEMEDNVPNLDYEVDGVVVSVDSFADQTQLGRHGDPKTGNPKGKIAWKFAEEEAQPVLKEKEWKTGRTGKIVPVAIFDAVHLAGTNVRRATLHNYGFMLKNKIDVGTKLRVIKAGKIIPKVIGVAGDPCKGKPSHPEKCPSCGSKTVVEENDDNFELKCPNTKSCPSQNISGLEHYLKTFGVLGLGESKITALAEGGAVRTFSDFYRLDVKAAEACNLSKRQAMLALAGIHMIPNPDKLDDADLSKELKKAAKEKKKIPLWKLFASFGIQSAGKSCGKALVEAFPNFDAIRNASVDDLAAVPDVGEKTAEIIHAYLRENSDEIDKILKYVEPELPKKGPLTGKSYVLSGTIEKGKAYWKQKIEDLGGKTGDSVSKNTSYLVAGDGSGSKTEKAKKYDVPIITVDDLAKQLKSHGAVLDD